MVHFIIFRVCSDADFDGTIKGAVAVRKFEVMPHTDGTGSPGADAIRFIIINWNETAIFNIGRQCALIDGKILGSCSGADLDNIEHVVNIQSFITMDADGTAIDRYIEDAGNQKIARLVLVGQNIARLQSLNLFAGIFDGVIKLVVIQLGDLVLGTDIFIGCYQGDI